MKRLLIFLFFLYCARKALPPSPDRFAPRLVHILVPYNTSLVLLFNEPLDTLALDPSNFLIYNRKDTLKIQLISFYGGERNAIQIITEPQFSEKYTIEGMVMDQVGNVRNFKGNWKGTTAKDTIPPRLVSVFPKPEEKLSFPYKISVSFSEPLDTQRFNKIFSTIPLDEFQWEKGLSEFKLVVKDTSYKERSLDILIPPYFTDFSRNYLELPYSLHFRYDTLMFPFLIKGNLIYDSSFPGMVLLKRHNQLTGFGVSDSRGYFSVWTDFKDSTWVYGWVDSDRDGISEWYAEKFFSKLPDSLVLDFYKEKVEILRLFE